MRRGRRRRRRRGGGRGAAARRGGGEEADIADCRLQIIAEVKGEKLMASRYKHTNRSREEGCGSPRSCASVDFAIAQSRILLLVETAVRMQIVCESPSKILILSCWSVVALHFVRGGRILLKSVAEFWRATLICILVTECRLQRVRLSHLLVVGDFSHSSWRTVTFAKLPANFRLSSDSEENSEDARILLATVSLLKMCDFVRGQIVNSTLYCPRVLRFL